MLSFGKYREQSGAVGPCQVHPHSGLWTRPNFAGYLNKQLDTEILDTENDSFKSIIIVSQGRREGGRVRLEKLESLSAGATSWSAEYLQSAGPHN